MNSFSEYLNQLVNSSLPIQKENTFVLKKNLCTKDEIIKKLVETLNIVLATISTKSNNQHSNTLNQSSSSLPSDSLYKFLQHKAISFKRTATCAYFISYPAIHLAYSSQLREVSHPIQIHHQRSEQNIAIKKFI